MVIVAQEYKQETKLTQEQGCFFYQIWVGIDIAAVRNYFKV